MAITYHAGRRIQGTSTDATAIAGGWKELGRTTLSNTPSGSATFTSDFSSATGWTATGSTPAVNTGTEKIDFESATSANIKAQLTYDLTSTSNTAWILRCKLNVTTFTQPTTEYHRFFIGLSSSTSNLNTSEDAIGLKYELGTGSLDRLVAIDTNGSAIRATTGDNFTHTSAVETLYVEIIRQSATTYDVNLRTGSHSGTLVEGKTGLTVSASTTGLQYLKIGSYSDNAGNGELSGTINDIQFWNDQTIGAGDDITVSSLDDKRYYMVLGHGVNDGTPQQTLRFNGDDQSNYGRTYSDNGNSQTGSTTDRISIGAASLDGSNSLSVSYVANKSNKEKIVVSQALDSHTAGVSSSANNIRRYEATGKWSNATDAINSITIHNPTTGNFDVGSECIILGYDPTDTHTDNFWELLKTISLTGQSTDDIDSGIFTNKKYLWVQLWCKGTTNTTVKMTFNNSTDSTYGYHYSNNGGSDDITEGVSKAFIKLHNTKANATKFLNMFIVNDGTHEPLGLSNEVEDGGSSVGSSNDPDRSDCFFKRSTATAITRINFNNDDTGNFTDWELRIWGSN